MRLENLSRASSRDAEDGIETEEAEEEEAEEEALEAATSYSLVDGASRLWACKVNRGIRSALIYFLARACQTTIFDDTKFTAAHTWVLYALVDHAHASRISSGKWPSSFAKCSTESSSRSSSSRTPLGIPNE